MNDLPKNLNLLYIKIATIVLIAVVAGTFILPNLLHINYLIGIGIILMVSLSFTYAVLARYYGQSKKKKLMYTNKYHDVFFKGTIIFAVTLAILSFVYSFFIYVDGDDLFALIGLLLIVIWICVFMIYFVWAVYHYNINYGITDEEWETIFQSKNEAREFGIDAAASNIEEPLHNPYRSQTFGLPPGTVRGMIALTLLIGGVSLLIASFGANSQSGSELALRAQQFEFFETAFLMMIAFYFGDRSLKYIRRRWEKPENTTTHLTKAGEKTDPVTPSFIDDVDADDQDFLLEDEQFERENASKTTSSITGLKNALINTKDELTSHIKDKGFVQIMDNVHAKILNNELIEEGLEELRQTDNIILSMPVVKAIIEVESAGRGHLSDGRAKILFEGHKFWHWLKQSKDPAKNPAEIVKGNEDILYEKWTRKFYLGGTREYTRFDRAKKIDEKAAIYAASWGLFQILGENMEHHIKSRKYKNVNDFEEKQHESEYYHFLDFLAFIKDKKIRGKSLIHYVSEEMDGNYDWASFAFGYNGSGYAVNKYDEKLKAAYDKFRKTYK
ncbi:MAG: N-acetylmuramidase domain-containing protein [Cyclobacteriaceae bacterium]